jgi:hypothetical protein
MSLYSSEPTVLTDEIAEYLDHLRDTGLVNMFGAAPYIESEFGISRMDAKTALIEWMNSYGNE